MYGVLGYGGGGREEEEDEGEDEEEGVRRAKRGAPLASNLGWRGSSEELRNRDYPESAYPPVLGVDSSLWLVSVLRRVYEYHRRLTRTLAYGVYPVRRTQRGDKSERWTSSLRSRSTESEYRSDASLRHFARVAEEEFRVSLVVAWRVSSNLQMERAMGQSK